MLYLRELDNGQYSLDYETIFKDFPKDLFPNESTGFEKEFDEKGRLKTFTRSDFNNSIFLTTYYTYDEYNNLVQRKDESSSKDYKNYEIANYHYLPFKDSIDRLISEINYESDPDRFGMKQYFYNRKFKLIEVRELSSFGRDEKTNYYYDDSGRVVSQIRYNLERSLRTDNKTGKEFLTDSLDEYDRKDYEYNHDGTLKQTVSGCTPYLVKAACIKITFEYDINKRIIKKYFYWMDSLFSRREYQYNSDNSINKLEWFYKGEIKSRNYIEYFYKDKELAKAIFTDGDKVTVFEFKYQLDSHNNWTEQIKIVDEKPFYIRKREIAYWE